MATFTFQLDRLGEHPRNETIYFLTRQDVIEAARAEIAELLVQRRTLAERLAQGLDSPNQLVGPPRASMSQKIWISIRYALAMRDFGSWAVSRARRPVVHLGVQLFQRAPGRDTYTRCVENHENSTSARTRRPLGAYCIPA